MTDAFDPLAFDRDLSLAEMLGYVHGNALADGMEHWFGSGWCIIDTAGHVLLGPASAALAHRAPIKHEGETVGFLTAHQAHGLAGAARLLEAALASANRYRMAVSVHEAAVAEDFAALQQKHQALLESEARYRQLCDELEARVAEQVGLIQNAQRQLYQAEKMATVGQLAAGMAHEINNPIGFIRSNLSTARNYVQQLREMLDAWRTGDSARAGHLWKRMDGDFILEDFASLLDESIHGAERIARIVADLKTFSSVDKADHATTVDVNECIQATANVAGPMAAGRIVLELAQVPAIEGHPGRLNQVFLGLVQNALAALRDDGSVKIRSDYQNGEVRVAIADDGCGIPQEVLARIFDPFYTTRDVGKGTGLGLTVSRDIVQAHGGRIEVQSMVGVGSTFTVCLPVKRRGA